MRCKPSVDENMQVEDLVACKKVSHEKKITSSFLNIVWRSLLESLSLAVKGGDDTRSYFATSEIG